MLVPTEKKPSCIRSFPITPKKKAFDCLFVLSEGFVGGGGGWFFWFFVSLNISVHSVYLKVN